MRLLVMIWNHGRPSSGQETAPKVIRRQQAAERLNGSQRAAEYVVGLGQDPGELGVVLLNVAHGSIDLRADIFGFGAVQQIIEPRLGGQIKDASAW